MWGEGRRGTASFGIKMESGGNIGMCNTKSKEEGDGNLGFTAGGRSSTNR